MDLLILCLIAVGLVVSHPVKETTRFGPVVCCNTAGSNQEGAKQNLSDGQQMHQEGTKGDAKYRAGIIAVFISPLHPDQILAGCRNPRLAVGSVTEQVWQLPQGGINDDDLAALSREEAERGTLVREMHEELGLLPSDYQVIRTSCTTTKYDWENSAWLKPEHARRYRGQEHRWFLCQLNPTLEPLHIDLEQVQDQEFCKLRWNTVDEALQQTVEYKRAAYEAGFQMLGLL